MTIAGSRIMTDPALRRRGMTIARPLPARTPLPSALSRLPRMTSPLALHHATLFDSTSGELRPDATVTVDGVGFGTALPPGARAIDLAGRTLLPGLIDAHVHVTATIPDFFRLTLLQQQGRHLPLIMKAGKLHKNELAATA
jgi:hypothetical protein